jgi:CRISPR system Cascade subunit CasE
MTQAIHLIRMGVDAQKLYDFARRSHLPAREFDEGYAVHALLAALFDHGAAVEARVAPKPFRLLDPSKRMMDVLGYSKVDHTVLADRAKFFADPVAFGVCDFDGIVSRPVPSFRENMLVGFSVRVCPVRRVAKRGNQRKDRAEVDAFLAKVWEVDSTETKIDREMVYRDWLREQLEKDGAARLASASLESFKLGRQHRRTQGTERHGSRVSHPEAQFEGVLEVGDPDVFSERLARGLGRHRSFGFGMLLLRPPRPSPAEGTAIR